MTCMLKLGGVARIESGHLIFIHSKRKVRSFFYSQKEGIAYHLKDS